MRTKCRKKALGLKAKRSKNRRYTKGQLNKLVDSLCHPFCENDARFILLDSLLHALIEQDPKVTLTKFVKYNVPKLVEHLGTDGDGGG